MPFYHVPLWIQWVMVFNNFALKWRKIGLKIFLLTLICTASPAAINWMSMLFSVEHIPENFPSIVTFKIDDLSPSKALFFKPHKAANKQLLKLNGATTFNSTYNLPGYYHAQLSDQAGRVISKDVYVKSKGWMASLGSFDNPEYLDVTVNRQQRQIGLSSGSIFRVESRAANQPITFHYFDAFNPISSLNFSFEFRFKVTEKLDSDFPLSAVQVEGINGKYVTPIYSTSQYIEYPFIVSNKTIPQEHIPVLYGEGQSWNHYRMKVRDGYVTYQINDRPPVKLPITASIGQIIGLRFSFNGPASFKDVTLTDTKEVVFVPTF